MLLPSPTADVAFKYLPVKYGLWSRYKSRCKMTSNSFTRTTPLIPCVFTPVGSGFTDSVLISPCLPESICLCLSWSLKERQERRRQREVCGCVFVAGLCGSCWWWLISRMRIFERCSVFCLYLICSSASFSSSFYLLFLSTCVSLRISFIISRIIIPPLLSEPTHSHLPAWVCARAY